MNRRMNEYINVFIYLLIAKHIQIHVMHNQQYISYIGINQCLKKKHVDYIYFSSKKIMHLIVI